jgi:hypothetical protein
MLAATGNSLEDAEMANQLKNADRAALLALMGAGGEMSNTELEAIAGFRIDGQRRLRLNARLLVESERHGGNAPFVHTLTRTGWAWCTEELLADLPDKPGPLGGALYAVLRGLDAALQSRHLTLLEFLSSAEVSGGGDIESAIRAAYRKLAAKPGDWVRLAALRSQLNGAAHADVDGVLRKMSRTKQARITPDSNRRALTPADHKAAIRIGGQDNHQIAIEGS